MYSGKAKISKFWSFISSHPDAEAALADWRFELQNDLDFGKLYRNYLVPNRDTADLIKCQKPCSSGCGFRRVCEFNGKYEAVCREWPQNSYPIEKNDILYFTVNPGSLLPEIIRLFQIIPDVDVLGNLEHTWKLGKVQISKRNAVPVYMTMKHWNREIVDLIFKLNRIERRPYMLLVTARNVIKETSDEALWDMNSIFIPLNEVLDFNADVELEFISSIKPYWKQLGLK